MSADSRKAFDLRLERRMALALFYIIPVRCIALFQGNLKRRHGGAGSAATRAACTGWASRMQRYFALARSVAGKLSPVMPERM